MPEKPLTRYLDQIKASGILNEKNPPGRLALTPGQRKHLQRIGGRSRAKVSPALCAQWLPGRTCPDHGGCTICRTLRWAGWQPEPAPAPGRTPWLKGSSESPKRSSRPLKPLGRQKRYI